MRARFAFPVVLSTLLAFLSTQSGCSFLIVRGPPSDDVDRYDPEDDPPCTTNRAPPIVDLVLAGALGASALALAARAGGGTTAEGSRDVTMTYQHVMVGELAVAVILAVSSFWGFSTVGHCREFLQPHQGQRFRTRGSLPEDEP